MRRICLSAALGLAAIGATSSASACPTLSSEVEQRIAQGHARARMDADAVVIGTWRDLSGGDDSCGTSEDGANLCKAKVVPTKILRGGRLPEFPIRYDRFIIMCDTRSTTAADGNYGKFYLARGEDGTGFRLIEFVEKRRKPQ